MAFILELSKENPDLAAYEVISLLNLKKRQYKTNQNLFIIKKNPNKKEEKLLERLACTKRIYESLFEADKNKLINKINAYNWNKPFKKDFSARAHFLSRNIIDFFKNNIEKSVKGSKNNKEKINETISLKKSIKNIINKIKNNKKIKQSKKTIQKIKDSSLKSRIEEYLASIIWNRLDKPKVNLAKPSTPFNFFITKNKVYAAVLKKELNHKFNQRKSHKLPGLHPISLHPKLARAAVNFTGIRKGTILDPFCGTGGILIEAALMKLKPAGYDINEKILKKCRKNLKFLKIKNVKLKRKDSLKLKKKTSYIATDLPYGINTKSFKKEAFYSNFLKTLDKNLKKKAVVIFPNNADYKKLIKKTKLKIEKEFSIYIHKSLTRRIVIITR